MQVLLITGAHQSGKSRALWRRLRAEAVGAAVLVTPAGPSRALTRQALAAGGPGLLPPVLTVAELVEHAAPDSGDARGALTSAQAAHLLAPWCVDGLAHSPWARVARFGACARELAELCLRLDAALVADEDLARARAACADDPRLQAEIDALGKARRELHRRADAHGLATPGERLRRLVAGAPALRWSAIYADDLLSLDGAELALLAALARDRRLVVTAVDDERLGDGALIHRLRRIFPDAVEERLGPAHRDSGHAAGPRSLLDDGLRLDQALPVDAADRYRYRDPIHAGRAIAAWLRLRGAAPGHASLFMRACDAEGLAVADALAAAEVPVVGTFRVPWTATAGGALFLALGAWCRRQGWAEFVAVCTRIAAVAAAEDAAPPEPLAPLVEPFAHERAAEAVAQLRAAVDSGLVGAYWRWIEGDRARPRLAALVGWLEARLGELQPTGGGWSERLRALCARFDCGEPAAAALARLADLERLGEVGARQLQEVVDTTAVEVRRGDGLDPERALLVLDAVRGRSSPRPVAIVHGLEHGRWPAPVRRPGLLGTASRRRIAEALGPAGDPFDEAGQRSGELASFLAVVARGTRRVALGIPCGEREPSPWLVALAGQLGWDIERLRAEADGEAAAGAPLGPADSQGGHERALWRADRERIAFAFRAPPQPLDVRPSQLGTLLADPLQLLCERLGLPQPLVDARRMRLGEELHEILANVVRRHADAARWHDAADEALDAWVFAEADPFRRMRRGAMKLEVLAAVDAEADLLRAAPGARCLAETPIACAIELGDGRRWEAQGKADRIDVLADGRRRVVDYKLGPIARWRAAVQEGLDGQLGAYLHALGDSAAAGHYRSLRDGGIAGWCADRALWEGKKQARDLAELPQLLDALRASLSAWADGRVATTPDGPLAGTALAPIARIDEARLDLGDGCDAEADA